MPLSSETRALLFLSPVPVPQRDQKQMPNPRRHCCEPARVHGSGVGLGTRAFSSPTLEDMQAAISVLRKERRADTRLAPEGRSVFEKS